MSEETTEEMRETIRVMALQLQELAGRLKHDELRLLRNLVETLWNGVEHLPDLRSMRFSREVKQ